MQNLEHIQTVEEYRNFVLENAQDRTNYAYFGDLDAPPWGKLGFAGQHRDSDVLDRSNFEVISEDLSTRFPDAFTIERDSHWAVGWVEGIRIDTRNEAALQAALDWKLKLEDYPVADEDHYSNLEMEEADESWESYGRLDFAEWAEELEEYSWLVDADTGELTEAGEFVGAYAFTDAYREDSSDFEYFIGDALFEWRLMQRFEFEKTQPPLPGVHGDQRS